MSTHMWKRCSTWALLFAVLATASLSTGAQGPRSTTPKGIASDSLTAATEAPPTPNRLVLTSSSRYLAEGFAWAKQTALSKVHPDNGGCYQAALPDRGGYCQRDFVHQIDGAALLGLHRENLTMLRCFATHQTEARGWFTLWEINYDGTPMACDYRDDQHFWRNTAGMFDLVHGAWRQFLWTANPVLGTQRRAFEAYARFLRAGGDPVGAEEWTAKAERLRRVFNDTWYDVTAGRYRIGIDRGTKTIAAGATSSTSWTAGPGIRKRRLP